MPLMFALLAQTTSTPPITELPAVTPTGFLWVALIVAAVVAVLAYLTFRK